MFRVINCLSGSHDLRLVVLAGFVCFFASFVGINLLGRARATKGHTRTAWLALAGIATGCGIWATHFIAMLAYEPGVPIAFDIGFTGLSLIFAATITGVAFSIAVDHPSLPARRWRAPSSASASAACTIPACGRWKCRAAAAEKCDKVQGFLIGRPEPIEHYAKYVGRKTAVFADVIPLRQQQAAGARGRH
jgi:hypothetical protein